MSPEYGDRDSFILRFLYLQKYYIKVWRYRLDLDDIISGVNYALIKSIDYSLSKGITNSEDIERIAKAYINISLFNDYRRIKKFEALRKRYFLTNPPNYYSQKEYDDRMNLLKKVLRNQELKFLLNYYQKGYKNCSKVERIRRYKLVRRVKFSLN